MSCVYRSHQRSVRLWMEVGVNGLVRADAYEIATEAIREV